MFPQFAREGAAEEVVLDDVLGHGVQEGDPEPGVGQDQLRHRSRVGVGAADGGVQEPGRGGEAAAGVGRDRPG